MRGQSAVVVPIAVVPVIATNGASGAWRAVRGKIIDVADQLRRRACGISLDDPNAARDG